MLTVVYWKFLFLASCFSPTWNRILRLLENSKFKVERWYVAPPVHAQVVCRRAIGI